MEIEEEPLSDDDFDLDSFASDKEEIYLQNELEERVIVNQEMILELNKEIGKLKSLYPEQISHPLPFKIVNHVSHPENKTSKILKENVIPPSKNAFQSSSIIRNNKGATSYSAENKSENANNCQQNSSSQDFDEIPIGKTISSFQEHLDDAMQKFDSQQQLTNVKQKRPVTRPFLRKGQGLQRFENKSKNEEESEVEKQFLNFSDKTRNSSNPNDNRLKTPSDKSKSSSNQSIPKVSSTKTVTLPLKKLVMKKTFDDNKSLTTNSKNKSPSNDKTVSSVQNKEPAKINGVSHVSNNKISNAIQTRERNFGPDESQPLNEFEILEGYAMDDASFLSSVSTVDRVLQQHHGVPIDIRTDSKPSPVLKEVFLEKNNSKNLSKTSKISSSEASIDLKTSTHKILNSNHSEKNVKSFSKDFQDKKHSDDIIVLDVKRKILTTDESEISREEQIKLSTSSDEVFVQRGAYVPSLYAASGNDETFSTDGGSTRGDGFEDESSWNDDTLREEKQTKEDDVGGDIRSAIVVSSNSNRDHPNKSHLPSIVNKIFPASNCVELKESVPKEANSDRAKTDRVSGDAIHSKLLRERILELEVEMERYKREHAALSRARKEHASLVASFKKETEEFKKKKKLDEEEFENRKNEEMQKLKKEKKIFEMYKKSHEDLFYVREEKKAQESTLKSDLEKLSEDAKIKEQRWKANSERMRDRIERLEKENLELKERLFSKEQELLKIKNQNQTQTSKKSRDRYSFDQGLLKNNKASSIPNPPCLVQSEITAPDKPAPNIPDPKDEMDSTDCDPGYRELRDESINRQDMPDGSIKVSKIVERVKNEDGSETIRLDNGDIQQNFADGSKLYVFVEHDIRHYSYPDGLRIFNFPCGQVEKIFADGNKEIVFTNGNLKYIYTDGSEETILQDGTVIKVQADNTIVKELVNGIKEIYYDDTRRIEYQDGTVKIIYKDGSQETRYMSGRVRMKDSRGNLTFDGFQDR